MIKTCIECKNEAAKSAYNGHLECLKIAKNNGCKTWDFLACEVAAQQGNLECLVWAYLNGAKVGHFTCEAAYCNKQDAVLEWALAKEFPIYENRRILYRERVNNFKNR